MDPDVAGKRLLIKQINKLPLHDHPHTRRSVGQGQGDGPAGGRLPLGCKVGAGPGGLGRAGPAIPPHCRAPSSPGVLRAPGRGAPRSHRPDGKGGSGRCEWAPCWTPPAWPVSRSAPPGPSLPFSSPPSFPLFQENRTHQDEAETAPYSQGGGATTFGDLGCPVLLRTAEEPLSSL